ncbi:hypothetical protein L596_029882 [Steinernema carpocapsae]|uniref:Uncharacterized protein n=1 Tax=Steinernema carpocapsae TaxID=34508 RepID=A0A4U5LR34_STECR|nr:hypothetical protein L596_029882 [Steinernema carpocapsae]
MSQEEEQEMDPQEPKESVAFFYSIREDVMFTGLPSKVVFLLICGLLFGYCIMRTFSAYINIKHYRKKLNESYQPPILDDRYFTNAPDYVKTFGEFTRASAVSFLPEFRTLIGPHQRLLLKPKMDILKPKFWTFGDPT